MPYRVILIGASGLIGSKLLSMLIASDQISDVLLILRRRLDVSHVKIHQLIINFDDLPAYRREIQGDIIFSCLGTTRTETPDPDLYKKIDLEYPLSIALYGLENGVQQFHIVSSIGADAASSNAYLKLKGQLENELKKINYPSLHIYQPSYLTGERKKKRISDKIISPLLRLIDPLLAGPFKKYRSIPAEKVARAILNQSLKDLRGSFTYPSIQIQQLA